MMQPPKTYLRLLSALLISMLVHVLMVWLTPISWQPMKRPQEVVRTIRLIPQQPIQKKPKKRRKRIKKRKVAPKKRQNRRRVRRKRRIVKRKRRKRRTKRRIKRRRRLAMAVPRPIPRRPTPAPPRDRPDAPPPKRRAEPVRKRRSYKHLDLRPQRLPTLARRPAARSGKGKAGKTGKSGKGKKLVPWAGNSRFARNMRAYHRAFVSDLNDRRGLVDAFFGTATIVMDRCIEIWIQRNIGKHLSTKEKIRWFNLGGGMPQRKPQWKGMFTVRINAKGKRKVKLLKSYGLRKLDSLLYKTAKRCMKRLKLPKRLKGKRIYIKFRTKAFASYRLELKNLLGLTEVRNAQTGGMQWKFKHFGSLSVSSNTLILKQSVY